MKRLFIGIGVQSSLFIGLMVYISFSIPKAKALAHDFCQTVHVGDQITEVENRAKSVGFSAVHNIKKGETKGALMAQATGFGFLRFYCDIEYVDNKVTKIKNMALD